MIGNWKQVYGAMKAGTLVLADDATWQRIVRDMGEEIERLGRENQPAIYGGKKASLDWLGALATHLKATGRTLVTDDIQFAIAEIEFYRNPS